MLFSFNWFGAYTAKKILKEPQGSDKMKEIASAIQEGAQAYLNDNILPFQLLEYLLLLFFTFSYITLM